MSSNLESNSRWENIISTLNKTTLKSLRKTLEGLNFATLLNLREHFDDYYYNTGESLIPDEKYDVLKEILEERDERQKEFVGAKLREGANRVRLPYWLGSMDKFKPEDEDKIGKWVKKYPAKGGYFVTEKLDGVSCLFIFDGQEIKLYTRGDGKIGADISYLAKYLNYIPKRLREPIIVRGELILTKKKWEKYSSLFSNPRNFVSGLVNAKTAREGLDDIDFISYEIISSDGSNPPISQQFKKLEKEGFRVAKNTTLQTLTPETLSQTLRDFKARSDYNIDGIIIQADREYTRNTSGNPGYAFAFKMTSEGDVYQTEVIRVEWNLSKRGFLKPRVEVKPVNMDGVIVKYATGIHARNIYDNGIGPGAIVTIIRSGDVIPKIIDVLKKVEPDMPGEEYVWNKTKIDISPVKIDQKAFCAKIILDFFSIFSIANVSEGTIRKFMENGLDTVLKILAAKKEDFAVIEGLGEKSAEKIYKNIHNGLKDITLAQLMAASSLFGHGVGVKKLETLLEEVPNLLTFEKDEMREKILGVKGFSEITADKIVENIEPFIAFQGEISPFITFKKMKKNKKGDVGLKVVFSGFRDKELEGKIKDKGGEVTTAVSGKTTHLVVADKEENSTKIEKAKKLGIPILSREEFEEYFEGLF